MLFATTEILQHIIKHLLTTKIMILSQKLFCYYIVTKRFNFVTCLHIFIRCFLYLIKIPNTHTHTKTKNVDLISHTHPL